MKIRVPNEKLWEHAENGRDIDKWLKENIGYGNYKEWIGFTALPYRSFEFKNEKDELLFTLTWT